MQPWKGPKPRKGLVSAGLSWARKPRKSLKTVPNLHFLFFILFLFFLTKLGSFFHQWKFFELGFSGSGRCLSTLEGNSVNGCDGNYKGKFWKVHYDRGKARPKGLP
jgi:hypothetical protein